MKVDEVVEVELCDLCTTDTRAIYQIANPDYLKKYPVAHKHNIIPKQLCVSCFNKVYPEAEVDGDEGPVLDPHQVGWCFVGEDMSPKCVWCGKPELQHKEV